MDTSATDNARSLTSLLARLLIAGIILALGVRRAICDVADNTTDTAKTVVVQVDSPLELHDQLVDRLRTASVVEEQDKRFPRPLFIGGYYGGQLLITSITIDPARPDTLQTNFDQWNVAARASLLIRFADLNVTRSRKYSGLSESENRAQRLIDHRDVEQITQVIERGDYRSVWGPFASAYKSFRQRARQRVSPSTTLTNAWAQFEIIDRTAQQFALHRLVRETRIDPSEIANEMLRLVDRANESAGAAGTRDALLYSCDALNSSGVPDSFEDNHGVPTRAADSLHVNLRMWHPLAPAFTRAWTAVQSRSGDASAGQIIATFQRAKEEFGRWVGAHSSADSNARDAALNRIAAELGLLELLRKYESGKAAG